MEKPPLVTDRALGNLPITQPTVNLLEKVGLGKSLFTEVDTNPPNTNLDAVISVFKEGDHDRIVALGGGSALDLGEPDCLHGQSNSPCLGF